MSEKENGGPAFPHPQGWRRDPEISDGMSMRDYFAAKAVQGFLASWGVAHELTFAQMASEAYAMADVMLAERAKGEK